MFSDKVSVSFQTGVLGISLALSVGLNIFQSKALIDVRRVAADLRKSADSIQLNSYNAYTYASSLESILRENDRLREINQTALADGL